MDRKQCLKACPDMGCLVKGPSWDRGGRGLRVGIEQHDVRALGDTVETWGSIGSPLLVAPHKQGPWGGLCLGKPGVALVTLPTLGSQNNSHVFWGPDPGGNTLAGVLRECQNGQERQLQPLREVCGNLSGRVSGAVEEPPKSLQHTPCPGTAPGATSAIITHTLPTGCPGQ